MNKSTSRYVEEDVEMGLNRLVRKDLASRFHLNRKTEDEETRHAGNCICEKSLAAEGGVSTETEVSS